MKRKIIIEFETGNDAFKTEDEISEGIEEALHIYFIKGFSTFKDENGNTVVYITEEAIK